MERVNTHMQDEHWWVFIHHPVQSIALITINMLLTYYLAKHYSRIRISTIILLLLSYGIGYITIKFSDDAISIFAFFWDMVFILITYMKVKHYEPRLERGSVIIDNSKYCSNVKKN